MTDQRHADGVLAGWDPLGPGVGIAIVRAGEVTGLACAGLAAVALAEPFTARSVVPIASLSKQFACTTILQLEADGVLARDDDVRRWVPELRLPEPVSLRQLMTNSSGLRDIEGLLLAAGVDLEAPYDHASMLELIVRQRGVVAPPDTEYLYCNTGFRLLAEIAGRATGSRWNALLHERVFGPLGMTSSSLATGGVAAADGLVTAYERDDAGAWVEAAGLLAPYAVPESGESAILSTLDDMARWAAARWRQDELGVVSRALGGNVALRGGGTSRYGFGVFDEPWRGRRLVRHNGGMPGLAAEVFHLPDDDLAIVCLTNQEETAPTRLAIALAERLLELPGLPVAPVTSRARYVDEQHGAVIDVREDAVWVWGWDVWLEGLAGGGVRSFSTWLELDSWPPSPTQPPRVARLGGVALSLVAVDPDPAPLDDEALVGTWRCDDLSATFQIATGPDGGGLVMDVEGPRGRHRVGTLWPATPRVVLVGDADRIRTSLRWTRDGLVLDRAEVRGMPLRRVGGAGHSPDNLSQGTTGDLD